MKKPLKSLLWILVLVIGIPLIVVFSSSGCRKVEESLLEIVNDKTEEETLGEATLEEEKEIAAEEGLSEELETGQEFIYQGKKIALTKYEFVQESYLNDQGEKLLFVYLYVENIDNASHSHTYDFDFVVYHQEREAMPLIRTLIDTGRESYDVGKYSELYPGEVCEGWTSAIIPIDWKAEDIEIHFKPSFGVGGTRCIWVLK